MSFIPNDALANASNLNPPSKLAPIKIIFASVKPPLISAPAFPSIFASFKN